MTDKTPGDVALAAIVDALKTKLGLCCNADSTKPMPGRAQRINGHQFYRCCLDEAQALTAPHSDSLDRNRAADIYNPNKEQVK